jgi:ankyrin repeat protein
MVDQSYGGYYGWEKTRMDDPSSWKIKEQKAKDRYKGKGSALQFLEDAQKYMEGIQTKLNPQNINLMSNIESYENEKVINISQKIVTRYESSLWQKIVNLAKRFLGINTELNEIMRINVNIKKINEELKSNNRQNQLKVEEIKLPQSQEELVFKNKCDSEIWISQLKMAFDEKNEVMQEQLFKNMDVKKTENFLKQAIELGEQEFFQFLLNNIVLDKKIEVNKGCLFYCAISSNKLEIAKILKEVGADINTKEAELDMTPLVMAVVNNNEEIVQWLCEQSEIDLNKGGPLAEAIGIGKNDGIIQLLLDKGADVNTPSIIKRKGPLQLATESCNIEMVEKLISKGSKVQKNLLHCLMTTRNVCDDYDFTEDKIFSRYKKMVDFLLEQEEIDINFQVRNGNTPLILACQNEDKLMVKLLVNKGADLNISNKDNESPLGIAKTLEDQTIYYILVGEMMK